MKSIVRTALKKKRRKKKLYALEKRATEFGNSLVDKPALSLQNSLVSANSLSFIFLPKPFFSCSMKNGFISCYSLRSSNKNKMIELVLTPGLMQIQSNDH